MISIEVIYFIINSNKYSCGHHVSTSSNKIGYYVVLKNYGLTGYKATVKIVDKNTGQIFAKKDITLMANQKYEWKGSFSISKSCVLMVVLEEAGHTFKQTCLTVNYTQSFFESIYPLIITAGAVGLLLGVVYYN